MTEMFVVSRRDGKPMTARETRLAEMLQNLMDQAWQKDQYYQQAKEAARASNR